MARPFTRLRNLRLKWRSYLRDKKRILPCAVRLSGQIAGVRGLYVGAPAMIGSKGIEKVMNIRLKADEREMFMKSVAAVEKIIAECQEMEPEALAFFQNARA